jgi:hypothetical protein
VSATVEFDLFHACHFCNSLKRTIRESIQRLTEFRGRRTEMLKFSREQEALIDIRGPVFHFEFRLRALMYAKRRDRFGSKRDRSRAVGLCWPKHRFSTGMIKLARNGKRSAA